MNKLYLLPFFPQVIFTQNTPGNRMPAYRQLQNFEDWLKQWKQDNLTNRHKAKKQKKPKMVKIFQM